MTAQVASGLPAEQTVTLLGAVRSGIGSLDVIFLGSLVACLAFVPGFLAYHLNVAAGLLLMAIVGWPAFACLVRVTVRIVLDQNVGLVALVREASHWGRDSISGLLAAVPAACFVFAGSAWSQGGGWGMGISSAASLSLLVLACLFALTMVVTDFSAMPWRGAAARAFALVPGLVVVNAGAVVIMGAGIWAATAWSASLLPLVPGVVALCIVGGAWSTLRPNVPTDSEEKESP